MPIVYWSIVSIVLGACIGSFLNVVIYRWPRDLSVSKPSRSFCPNCRNAIAWYDNIPVLSYLLLRGRCRHCGLRISLQYPLVELATALVFLLLFDAFLVAQQRYGVSQLATDWPILLAHLAMFAGMIALAVMDLEAYMVDIRLTWIVSGVGILAHLFWTPASSADWIRPGIEGGVLALAATLGLGIGALLFLRRTGDEESPEGSDAPAASVPPTPVASPAAEARAPGRSYLLLIVPAVLVVAYVIWMMLVGVQPNLAERGPTIVFDTSGETQRVTPPDPGAIRLAVGLGLTFVALALAASQPQPEADQDIVEAIDNEASYARRQAVWELQLIAPAIVMGVGGVLLLQAMPGLAERLGHIFAWSPTGGDWRPMLGLSSGLFGWIIGGAVGWLARIVCTLLFGKEALGMGDIHILAAAGAVAGWPVPFLGFFLAAPLTLVAIGIIALRRQSRALPYGPWLALAFLIVTVFQDRILHYLGVRWMLSASPSGLPDVLP